MREPGYYWIKTHDNEAWRIGDWNGLAWSVCGSEVGLYDAAQGDSWGVMQVGERIPDSWRVIQPGERIPNRK